MPPPALHSELGGGRRSIAEFCSTETVRLSSLAQCRGAERSAEFGVLLLDLTPLRARDPHRSPGRRCGCWPTSPIPFPFYEIRQGANDGARAIGAKGCHRRRCTAS